MNSLKFISIIVNDTTNAYGSLTINNPTGSSAMFLLRNTYTDSVTSSFGVINVESTSTTSINLRFRTLSDGAANANAQISTTLIFAYK